MLAATRKRVTISFRAAGGGIAPPSVRRTLAVCGFKRGSRRMRNASGDGNTCATDSPTRCTMLPSGQQPNVPSDVRGDCCCELPTMKRANGALAFSMYLTNGKRPAVVSSTACRAILKHQWLKRFVLAGAHLTTRQPTFVRLRKNAVAQWATRASSTS